MTTLTNYNPFEQFAAWITGGKPRNISGTPITAAKKITTAEAKQTITAWRESIDKLNDSRREIAQPAGARKRRAPIGGTVTTRAREFVAQEKALGNDRPKSNVLMEKFGVTRSWANQIISNIYGECPRIGWRKGLHLSGTEERYERVRAYVAQCEKRPTQDDVANMFHVSPKNAQRIITERFGRYSQVGRKSPGSGRRKAVAK